MFLFFLNTSLPSFSKTFRTLLDSCTSTLLLVGTNYYCAYYQRHGFPNDLEVSNVGQQIAKLYKNFIDEDGKRLSVTRYERDNVRDLTDNAPRNT